jgi:hypothetical protein
LLSGKTSTNRQVRPTNAAAGWLSHGDLEGWLQRTIDDRRDWIIRLRDSLDTKGLAFDANGLRALSSP